MTERELIYVKTIADEHSISKAAHKLFLSQPSLSKCIQRIEASLGTTLFTRTNSGLILTYAGMKYYKIATNILKIYNDFEIEVSDINNLKKGRITIGITIQHSTTILPVILPLFKQKCPNIDISIIEKTSSELEKSLSNGEIDFAILGIPSCYDISNSSNINFYPLFKEQYVLVTKKNHPLAQYAVNIQDSDYPKIDLTLFADEPFIMLNPDQRIRQVADSILKKANINPKIVITTKSNEAARRLACVGMGVTLTPKRLPQKNNSDYQPDYYSIDEKYSPYCTTCVGIPKNSYVSKAAKLFIRMVSERCGSTILDL